jgi:transcriptional regulator with XRE-family HTH domain
MGRANRARPARLGEKLRHIRSSLGLTLEQMVERLGYTASPLHPQNISGFEREEREPPLLLLIAYAELANVYVEALIKDSVDLPAQIPSRKKHEGIARSSNRRKS